jgi:methylmalonyl-CoA/ethylmalonyl-CoA epimerase
MIKLHHIGILTNDIDKTTDFYQQVLGFHLINNRVKDEIQQCWLQLLHDDKGYCLELIKPIDSKSPVYSLLMQRAGPVHICYSTDHFEDDFIFMRNRKCVPAGKIVPAKLFNDKRIIFLLTPSDELIELLEI